jgi:hypothetical protein
MRLRLSTLEIRETTKPMHIDDRHILEVAQDGSRFNEEEEQHIRECENCSGQFVELMLQWVNAT